jgi:uncharacterized protein
MSRDSGPVVHFLPYKKDKTLVYFPLKGTFCVINKKEEYLFLGPKAKNFKQFFASTGLSKADKRLEPIKGDYCPTSGLHIFPTLRCNLNCVYCYSDANKEKTDLSLSLAKKGIDHYFERYTSNLQKIELFFAGGGEPTVNWPVLEGAVRYAQKKSEKFGKELCLSITFNGVINKFQRRFIQKNFNAARISFDGLKEIQNHQRLMINGEGSYDAVVETMNFFDDAQMIYDVRPTITNFSVKKMAENFKFITENFSPISVGFVPSHEAGKQQQGHSSSFVKEYVKQIKEILVQSSQKHKLNLRFSGNLFSLRGGYACALFNSFILVPGGHISTCTHVAQPADKESNHFFIGKFDTDENDFIIDHKKISLFQKLHVENIKSCRKCIAKYYCAGGCPYHNHKVTGSFFESPNDWRCQINRALLEIKLKLEAEKRHNKFNKN